MLLYASKVIVFTLIALCAVNFVGKRVLQIMELPPLGNSLLTQTMEIPPGKAGSVEFDPFTGKHNSIKCLLLVFVRCFNKI